MWFITWLILTNSNWKPPLSNNILLQKNSKQKIVRYYAPTLNYQNFFLYKKVFFFLSNYAAIWCGSWWKVINSIYNMLTDQTYQFLGCYYNYDHGLCIRQFWATNHNHHFISSAYPILIYYFLFKQFCNVCYCPIFCWRFYSCSLVCLFCTHGRNCTWRF